METNDSQKGLRCFYPVAGIAVGFVVGWILHYVVPKPTGWAEMVDAAGRLFMLTFGLFGWAFGVVLDNRKLHCGGTRELDTPTRHRYRIECVMGMALVVFAAVFLATTRLVFYFLTTFLLVCVLAGEIGYDSPWAVFRIPFNQGRE